MTEFEIRTKKLQQILNEKDIDAAIITSNTGLLYYVGRVLYGYYYIPKQGEAKLFVKMPLGLKDVTYIKTPKQIPDFIEEPKTLMLENGSIMASEYLLLKGIFGAEIIDGTAIIREQRSLKSENELSIIKDAAKIHCSIYEKIPALYKTGMTDTELSTAVEAELRRAGHSGVFRTFGGRMEIGMGSLLAGENGGYPASMDFALGGQGVPSMPSGVIGQTLCEGMSVMVDLSYNKDGYLTDLSRTFSVGKLTDEAYKMHDTSIEIQRELMKEAKEGARACDMYALAITIVERNGFADSFMGREQKAKFVGHGLGIEINEPPVLAPRMETELKEGMVIALEPKFIADGVGAVGTENTYIVRKDGLECITNLEQKIIDLKHNYC